MERNIYEEILHANEEHHNLNSENSGQYPRLSRHEEHDTASGESADPGFISFYSSVTGSPRMMSLADCVFGRQMAEKAIMLHHAEQLTEDRKRIHTDHIQELNAQRSNVISHLEAARRPYSAVLPQQVTQLERLLLQIESERQRTEESFWKDIAEIQKSILESAFAYHAIKDRYQLFVGLERSDG